MFHRNQILILFVGMLFFLAACGQELSTPAGPSPATTPKVETQVVEYVSETHDYSLLYPDYFSLESTTAEETVFFIGSLLNVQNPRLSVKVTEFGDQSLEQAVATFLADFDGYKILGTDLIVGNEPAIRLDGVPGQDMQRIVLIVRNGRLYQLTFSPEGASSTNIQGVLENLYDTVIDSFEFR
jgi:hypothetical protein